jgi:hypothetical protein
MSEYIINSNPTDTDINNLKSQLDDAKRQYEYEKLKDQLADITLKSVNTPNEFEGGMQVPDTDKVLHTKRQSTHLMEMIISRITKMLSPRPIIGNIIAIGVAIFALVFLQTEVTLHHFGQYQHYMGVGLLIFAGLQIIKSSSRSLLLPLLATVSGAVISHSLAPDQTLFTYGATFYQYMMIAGIIASGFSVLNVD